MKTALIASGLVLVTALAFASGVQMDEDATGPQMSPGPFGKYDPPIEVSFVGCLNESMLTTVIHEDNSLEDNMWTRAFVDRLGIQITYDWIARSDEECGQKWSVSVAAGDVPDMMEVQLIDLKRLYDAGALAPLQDAYDQYIWPKLKEENLDFASKEAWSSVRFDGELYAIPEVWGRDGGEANAFTWVRSDWLENLGLDVPVTFDDFVAVAEAFTHQDPDQDGQDDTYGMVLHRDNWGMPGGLEPFFNAHHAYPNIWIEDGQGGIVFGSVQPEMKAALRALHDLYERGIIDEEFAVRPADKVPEEIASERVGMINGPFWISLWPLMDSINVNPEADWLPLIPATVDGTEFRPFGNIAITGRYAVRNGYSNPEALMKMMNLYHQLVNEEADTYGFVKDGDKTWEVWRFSPIKAGQNLGAKGIQIAIAEALETGVVDPVLESGEGKQQYANVQNYLAGDRSNWAWYRIFGPGEPGEITYAGLYHYWDNDRFVIDKFAGAPPEAMVDKWGSLSSLQNEVIIKIIVGDYEADYFDEFVEDWHKLGGTEITAAVNEWYSSASN